MAGVSLGGLFINGTDGQFLDVDSELPHPDYDPGKHPKHVERKAIVLTNAILLQTLGSTTLC